MLRKKINLEKDEFLSKLLEIEDSIDYKNCIVKSRALKLIATEIDSLENLKDNKDLGRFLIDCGVKKEFCVGLLLDNSNIFRINIGDVYSAKNIMQANTTPVPPPDFKKYSRAMLVYRIMLYYSCSEEKNKKILFKIFENSIDPLLFDGDEEKTVTFKNKLNQYLKHTGYLLKTGIVKKISKKSLTVFEDKFIPEQGRNDTHPDFGYYNPPKSINVQKELDKDFEKIREEERKKIETRENIRIKRIEASGGNQLDYAIKEIIKKATLYKDSFQVNLHSLGFTETIEGMGDAIRFLALLKDNECINSFARLGNDSFEIKDVKIKKLKKYKKKLTKDDSMRNETEKNQEESPNIKRLRSIHLITRSLEPADVIFLVLDELFDRPIRFAVKNKMGNPAYIKKLYNVAYFVNAPEKRVEYSKNLADNINNGLFRKKAIADYMRTNKLKKPTLVQKSENDEILVLKGEIILKTELINNIPSQYKYLYIDKTN